MTKITKKEEEAIAQEEAKRKEILRSKICYYFDELSVFIFVVIGVIFQQAIIKRAQGQPAYMTDVFLDWLNLMISMIIGLTIYGTVHTQWKFNDKKKAPFIKRLITALSLGMATGNFMK